jgi:hypothetical protein
VARVEAEAEEDAEAAIDAELERRLWTLAPLDPA